MGALNDISIDWNPTLTSSGRGRLPCAMADETIPTPETDSQEPCAAQWTRALDDVRSWRLVETSWHQKAFRQKLKGAKEQILEALPYLRDAAAQEELPGTDAEVILGNGRFLRSALREAEEALTGSADLPYVESQDFNDAVPRVYAVSDCYLKSTEYSFDKPEFLSWMAAVQEESPLMMAETWSLKGALEFALLERIADAARQFLRQRKFEANLTSQTLSGQMRRCAKTLRQILALHWEECFEEIDETERILRLDPQRSYARMDRGSREQYRSAVGELAERSTCSEHEVARKAISLARDAASKGDTGSRQKVRRTHIGYYLAGAGREILEREIGYKAALGARIRRAVLKWPDYFYLLGIETVALAAIVLSMVFLDSKAAGIVALALLILPALECAVGVVNLATTSLIPPKKLPQLDFSKGIPNDSATIVAVPMLLNNERLVRAAVKALEIRFLGNRDANLHFALLTDPPDSKKQFDEKDELVGLCSNLIDELNERYAKENRGTFFHFHRHRAFNAGEQVWMGWERKRGKILEFNRLLLGENDAFPVKRGDLGILPSIRYVITLDLDTQLPPETAYRLIGTIAHPLNAAVVDPATGTVVEGYGILQPRLEISRASAERSRFSSLFSGDTGFDIYTRAVSDVYQDLFGEGIFTGKGIYEVEAFQKTLDGRFPVNAVLSHDLIEGAYARTGLVTDVALIDDYPADMNSFNRRKHRWVRGDWQITPWLLSRVRDSFGRLFRNPIGHVSRWKILDNLRRSLADTGILMALLFGWFFLPQDALLWTVTILAITFAPVYWGLITPCLSPGLGFFKAESWKNRAAEWAQANALIAVRLAFLLHQSLLSMDAIARTLVRMNLTHKGMLEWETAADAESEKRRGHAIDSYTSLSAVISLALGAAVALLRPVAFPAALPFLLTWLLAPQVSKWLNRPPKHAEKDLDPTGETNVRRWALGTWRFFREFGTAEENWLVPDIVRESPRLVAHRISTTNIGLLLNARLAAYDFGFASLDEFIADTEKTFRTIARMPKCNGHLYNWYTTDTLEPVEPLFISTVDNGNLVCSLWTMKEGLQGAAIQPLFRPSLWRGILDHIHMLGELSGKQSERQDIRFAIQSLKQRAEALGGEVWPSVEGIRAVQLDAAMLVSLAQSEETHQDVRWWAQELSQRVTSLFHMVEDFAPWLLVDFAGALTAPGVAPTEVLESLNLETIEGVYARAQEEISRTLRTQGVSPEISSQLTALASAIAKSAENAAGTRERLKGLAQAAQSLVDEMDFGFLYDPERKLLTIGYDAREGVASKWHYDLLPSEARAATFVAVAQGAVPQETWFHLGRFYGRYKGERVLLSWTGTMFEYLMPFLWMKPNAGSVLEKGARAAIAAHRKLADEKGTPWGMSECACNEQSVDGHYAYRAIGHPGLAVHRDEFSNDIVVAPYSSFLAMLVEKEASVRNLEKMEALGWFGAYGFYDASDFTPRRVGEGHEHEIVGNWMAHHQGMSLVAAANVLCNSAMQKRFHNNSIVAAAERVLQEAPSRSRVETVGEGVEEGSFSVMRRAWKASLAWIRSLRIWHRDFSRVDQLNFD
ncbi:MAG TPA: glucoamylase family protein [Candidatus Acidoferrum sp.]|nr:glucoamylase family protein [Candidatus Acidoferrum sp.]